MSDRVERIRARRAAQMARRAKEPPFIPPGVLEDITAHAYGQIRRNRECVGYLTVENGIAISYTRLRNWARGDYRFRTHHFDYAPDRILVHSHPTGSPRPSQADMSGASWRWLGRLYAIFVMPPHRNYPVETRGDLGSGDSDRLMFFILNPDRKTFEHVESLETDRDAVYDTRQERR